ncbi:hypothetical protein PR202_ga23597 [Eleusine coracana subsp. coracana]|uniref:Bowman-Birk serine protease inhibitors family domain-containing protein n=1 Tax=Eleusine coracana subsp. coracana TaxID=191504 RepID=A0AAV5D790_ELECO|nr:hypothetical protein PR202_ga23597 [Eleusine coracana subsp. coracana]
MSPKRDIRLRAWQICHTYVTILAPIYRVALRRFERQQHHREVSKDEEQLHAFGDPGSPGRSVYTCDDIVKKCDRVCKVCSAVRTPAGKRFQCTDIFLGICGPPCKKH